MLAFVNIYERVPPDHAHKIIKRVADDVLERMAGDFDRMYSKIGRASVPPEHQLKACFSSRCTRSVARGPSARNSTTTCSIAGSWTC